MTKRKFAVNDSVEALFAEKALAMFRELRQTAKDAPDGEVCIGRSCSPFARGKS